MFCVDDGGFIMAIHRRVYSCQLQDLIQELDLETKTRTLDLHASMVGYLTFNMSLHHWLLIERSHPMFDFNSYIQIR